MAGRCGPPAGLAGKTTVHPNNRIDAVIKKAAEIHDLSGFLLFIQAADHNPAKAGLTARTFFICYSYIHQGI